MMSRIRIEDLPKDMVISRQEMRKITGGYTDKDIMLGTAIPYNPLGNDSDGTGTSDTSETGKGSTGGSATGGSSGSSFVFPDVCKLPGAPSGPIPVPYPNIGSGGGNITKI